MASATNTDTGEPGDTTYLLSWLGEGPYRHRCCIREAGNPLAGDREFDTSLLQRVPR